MKQGARIWITAVSVVCLLYVFTGCKTWPPRVPSLPPESKVEDRALAVGDITVSAMKFTPITKDPKSDDRLAFGKHKTEDELFMAVRRANMGISQLLYTATAMQAAVALAGTQVNISDTKGSTSSFGVNPDLSSIVVDPKTGKLMLGEIPLHLTAGGTLTSETSETKSFKSPSIPDTLPAAPTVPEGFLSEFVKLMAESSGTRTLDPATEAELVAQEKMHRVELEQYYNLDGFFDAKVREGESSQAGYQVWQPYRVQFRVAVRPGWYTFLKQYEAVVKVDFNPKDENEGINDMRVLRVAPAETAQAIDEMLASYQEASAALDASGGFKAVAFNAAATQLQAAARRLEGFRKNTFHFVSYPDDHTVEIRMRPLLVANEANAQLQPTSALFSAVVLMKGSKSELAEKVKDIGLEFDKVNKDLSSLKDTLPTSKSPKILSDDLTVTISSLRSNLSDVGRRIEKMSLPMSEADKNAVGSISATISTSDDVESLTTDVAAVGDVLKSVSGSLYRIEEPNIQYSSWFEPGLFLKEKGGRILPARTFYFAPTAKDRSRLFLKDKDGNADKTLKGLIPMYDATTSEGTQ